MKNINYDNIIYGLFGESVVSTKRYKKKNKHVAKGELFDEFILKTEDKFTNIVGKLTNRSAEANEIAQLFKKNYDMKPDLIIHKLYNLKSDYEYCMFLYLFMVRVSRLYKIDPEKGYELIYVTRQNIYNVHKPLIDRLKNRKISYSIFESRSSMDSYANWALEIIRNIVDDIENGN